nr:MAG TPA: hypothetical protein [Caudoviricetes sp.]
MLLRVNITLMGHHTCYNIENKIKGGNQID